MEVLRKQLPTLHGTSWVLLAVTVLASFFTYQFSHINNWRIFRHSFFNLLEGRNLYLLYPEVATDIFVYSPTFALLIAPLSLLPIGLGGILWNLLGAAGLVLALERIPEISSHRKSVFWMILPEFIGSTQNFQANLHIIALLLWFWIFLEEEAIFPAAACVLLSFFIKIFGVVALVLLIHNRSLFQNPRFFLRFVGAAIVLFLILFLSPAVVSGWSGLLQHYEDWFQVLSHRDGTRFGFSLMGLIYGVTGEPVTNLFWQSLGGLSLLIALFWHRQGDRLSRLLSLVSVTYFVIVFNNQAESPTFIIAMVGFALHQALLPSSRWRWFLIIGTLLFVSGLYSDPLRPWSPVFNQYAMKCWPFLLLYPLSCLRLNRKSAYQRV